MSDVIPSNDEYLAKLREVDAQRLAEAGWPMSAARVRAAADSIERHQVETCVDPEPCVSHLALREYEREITAMLNLLGSEAIRVREGGGPENLLQSLAATIASMRSATKGRHRSSAPESAVETDGVDWKVEIEGALDLLGEHAVRVREGGGPENLAASLALTFARLDQKCRAPETEAPHASMHGLTRDEQRQLIEDLWEAGDGCENCAVKFRKLRLAHPVAAQKTNGDALRTPDDPLRPVEPL